MGIVNMILRLLMIAGAALLGNYVGEFIRNPNENSVGAKMGLVRATLDGRSVVGVRLNPTNFLPALVFAYFAGPPRFLAAFFGGALLSALLGDRFEPGQQA